MPRKGNMMLAVSNFEIATHYLASWLLSSYNSITAINKKLLIGEEMTRANLENQIYSFEPYFMVLGGHGGSDKLGGQHNNIVLDFSNIDITEGRIIYAFSCNTAAQLGGYAVSSGCVAYIGYRQDFVFIIDNNAPTPLLDSYAKYFFGPGAGIMTDIASGKTTRQAVENAKAGFNSGINYWRNSPDPEAPFMLSSLEQDRDVLTLHGDETATGGAGLITAGGGLLPLVAIGMGISYLYGK